MSYMMRIQEKILAVSSDKQALEAMPVDKYVALFVVQGG